MSDAKAANSSLRKAWWRILTALSVAVVLGTVTLQAFETRQLRTSVREWRRRAQWPAVGFGFPPLTVRTLEGATRVVGAGPMRTQVLAVFTSSCPYCRASLPVWRSLATGLDSLQDAEMVWLSLSPRDSTIRYAAEQRLPMDRVVLEPDAALLRAARIRGVPLTLVVDSGGIVRYVHAGVFTQLQADSIVLAARAPRAVGTVAPRRSSQ